MLKMYECEDVAEVYSAIYEDLANAPRIGPRGKETKELICPQILIRNPRKRLAFHQDRKWNLAYGLAEALLLFLPHNDLKYFTYFNRNMGTFSDDGKTVQGAYGKRISDHIPSIVTKIKNDPTTRQAAITILQADDVSKTTKDMPCTLSLQFIWRDGKLNMITNMRSNDIIWGFQYDVFMFTLMQEIIANTCGLEVGWYLHRPTSLHVYDYHYELFDQVAKEFKSIEMKLDKDYDYADWVVMGLKYLRMVDNEKQYDFFNDILRCISESKSKKLTGPRLCYDVPAWGEDFF